MRARALLGFIAMLAGLGRHALAGPDVYLGDIQSVSSYGPSGGTYAYSIGSHTCNIGNQNLLWTNSGTPGLAMNAYRLHDGRLVQVGQSWVKHACCVGNGSDPTVCLGMTCSSSGSGLRVGCRDVYSAGWNAGQGFLGPRSGINAFQGTFSSLPGGSGDAIFRRLQIKTADMNAAIYPGAQYFVEGVYVGSDDAASMNWLNNASYKRVTINTSFQMTLSGSIFGGVPAIYAWQHHGLGPNTPDPSVKVLNLDVPGEGRFIIANKVRDNQNGTWTYDYAVFNLNSHRSGGSFSVPLTSAVSVSGIGFNDVDYHSGEPFSNTNWINIAGASSLTWFSPQTFAQNPNTNALRWGTMYNFWFTANRPPVDGPVTLGLFRPGTPASVSMTVKVPDGTIACADVTGDGEVNFDDVTAAIAVWGPCAGCIEDVTGDGEVNFDDLLAMIMGWGSCQ